MGEEGVEVRFGMRVQKYGVMGVEEMGKYMQNLAVYALGCDGEIRGEVVSYEIRIIHIYISLRASGKEAITQTTYPSGEFGLIVNDALNPRHYVVDMCSGREQRSASGIFNPWITGARGNASVEFRDAYTESICTHLDEIAIVEQVSRVQLSAAKPRKRFRFV